MESSARDTRARRRSVAPSADLLRRVREGDEAAAAEVYQRLKGLGYFRIRQIWQVRPEDADDVYLDAISRFLGANQRSLLDSPARVFSVIVDRAVADHYRGIERGDRSLDAAQVLEPTPPTMSVEERCISRWDLENAFAAAGLDCVELVELILARGSTYREVAEARGVPQGTVASWVHRCVGRARDYLMARGYA